jgi:hypothetical protein
LGSELINGVLVIRKEDRCKRERERERAEGRGQRAKRERESDSANRKHRERDESEGPLLILLSVFRACLSGLLIHGYY